jgi:hypothetical protein
MSSRATSWLAWSLAALCGVLFLVALQIATLPVWPPSISFPIVGALIASRRTRIVLGDLLFHSGARSRMIEIHAGVPE